MIPSPGAAPPESASRTARPGENAEVRAWLERAAACLADSSLALPAPPSAELGPAYEAVLGAREKIEQSRRDLIGSVQMQSLHTVGSILAHDLHNISVRLSLLSQNLEQYADDPAFLTSARRVLDDTVLRMQSLVDGFRQRQETVIIKIPTDLNEVLHGLVRQMGLNRAPSIELVENYADIPPIWADSFFLANAFRVLLENAAEAVRGHGSISLRTALAADGRVLLEIADSGVGMSLDFIERELFAPFRSSSGRGGLGLGMYICRHIIQLHGGEIAVESELGLGACFRLYFPRGPETA
jgi:signal transduction histidine kinase